MNTVRFILSSDKDEDACRQRQYACNNSRDGKTGDCREADHDQINGKSTRNRAYIPKFTRNVVTSMKVVITEKLLKKVSS